MIFTDEEQLQLRRSVENAEADTLGEIRVCIEKNCTGNPLDRASLFFYKLEMDKTKQRAGVLIYVATVDRKFAIIGDAGINKAVHESFWDNAQQAMLEHFKFGNLVPGIIAGIDMAGVELKKHFPQTATDTALIIGD